MEVNELMKYKLVIFKRDKRKDVKMPCFFCRLEKKTIGYIYETSEEKHHYFFCNHCLKEILQDKIKIILEKRNKELKKRM